MCTFKNGTSCEEWALYRGEGCNPVLTPYLSMPVRKWSPSRKRIMEKRKMLSRTLSSLLCLQKIRPPALWNATLSPGLALQSDSYQDAASAGRVGAAGTHTWVIVGKVIGDQKFSAIYKRPWEPVTGNETAYSVNIRVLQP